MHCVVKTLNNKPLLSLKFLPYGSEFRFERRESLKGFYLPNLPLKKLLAFQRRQESILTIVFIEAENTSWVFLLCQVKAQVFLKSSVDADLTAEELSPMFQKPDL